jgi:hypothetical protein
MDRRRWLERVEAELTGRGLPAGVRARLLAELRDHLDDLTEGGSDMAVQIEQQMGDPGELAAAAAAGHRGWVRRHPMLVFVLAPIPAVLLAVTCYMLAVVGLGYAVGEAVGEADEAPPEGIVRSAADALFYGIAFIPFVGVAVALGRLAIRSGAAGWWAVVALCQVTVFAGLVRVQSTWSDLPGESQLMLGVGFPFTGWRQVAQMLLPLALGWFVLRARSPRPSAVA